MRTALTAIGLSYSKTVNRRLSVSSGLEFFDYYDDAFVIKKQNSDQNTDLGSVLGRTHVLTKLRVGYKLFSLNSFSSSIIGGVFLRFGSETIQSSPYNPNYMDALAVIRPYSDPGVNLGFETNYYLSPSWSLSVSLRYDQILWRKSKGPIRLNPSLPGTSKNFITFTYGVKYCWGNIIRD
ncbi:MAG: hypothetical protein WEC59_01790 [Salibacteraceae bacterium]